MGNTVIALKNLAVKLGCAENAAAVTGDTIADVLQFMADHYPTSPASG